MNQVIQDNTNNTRNAFEKVLNPGETDRVFGEDVSWRDVVTYLQDQVTPFLDEIDKAN